ncbi:MAG: VanZ family protein [Pirellulaceae bacterium]|nr:VanZ family protein [Pirellulaceae bacterium]
MSTVGEQQSAARPPAWPRRRHFAALTLLTVGVVVYGSLVPLNFEPLSLSDAWQAFAEIPYVVLGIEKRADWVANLLLFVPIGFFLAAAVNLDRRPSLLTIVWPALTVLACAGLSLALEFTQLWFPPRTVSQNDVLAETLGGAVGASLWVLTGERWIRWWRGLLFSRDLAHQLRWCLEAYTLLFLLYAVLPLDLMVSRAEWLQKVQLGRVHWVPAGIAAWDADFLGRSLVLLLAYVPPGMLLFLKSRRPTHPAGSLAVATAWGVLLVALVEAAQLPIFSRFNSALDVALGIAGVTTGAWCLAAGLPRSLTKALTWGPRPWLLATLAYAALSLVVACAPFDLVDDPQLRVERLRSILRVPFSSLYTGSEFQAVTIILRNVLWLAPLGILWGLALRAFRLGRRPLVLMLCFSAFMALAFCTGLELAQVLVASRHVDVTDVLIGSGASLAGLGFVWWLFGLPAPDQSKPST